VPDAHYGEELCAWLTLRPEAAEPLTAEAVCAFATGKLAHYKLPEYVNVSTSSR
jgi:fatty-acyl-CoA synthase